MVPVHPGDHMVCITTKLPGLEITRTMERIFKPNTTIDLKRSMRAEGDNKNHAWRWLALMQIEEKDISLQT